MRGRALRGWAKQDAPRILVVRNDGLGDFILTLPLIASLKQQRPHSHITVLAAASLLPLAPLLPDIDQAIGDEGVLLRRHRGRFPPAQTREKRAALLERLREARFDAALVVYAEGETARLVHRAGIPVRAGPLRRRFFWRFNAHFRASRKGSGQPEYALNLGYLPLLGLEAAFVFPRITPPQLALSSGGTEAGGGLASQPYAVLHPHKRSGTALTWPLEHFQQLARELHAGGLAVRVIGDEGDRAVLSEGFGRLEGTTLEIGRTLPQLTALIAGARLFAGNSSGPLHLAGLTGTPHVAIYPQDRVSAPERWRTLPHPAAPPDFRRYLLASRFPKNCTVCEGERCAYFNCAASIGMDAVRDAIKAWGVGASGG